MGGSRSSIVRACTGEVCVRSTRPDSSDSTKNVSCMVRAGWSGPMLSASKFSHSASTSGPSATSHPMATNTSETRSWIVVNGCREPRGARSQGSVTSTASSTRTRSPRSLPRTACRSAIAWPTARRAAPNRWPASLRASGGRAPVSRLASASGERAPAWARRTPFRASRSLSASIASSASARIRATSSGWSAVTSTGSYWLLGADMFLPRGSRMDLPECRRQRHRVRGRRPGAGSSRDAYLGTPAMCPGRGVEADGGRGREIQALRPAVDRDPDDVVGRSTDRLGYALGLVAEQPPRRCIEQSEVGGAVEIGRPGAVGHEHGEPLRLQGSDRFAGGDVGDNGQVEQAPGRRANALAAVRIHCITGEDDRARTGRIRRSDDGPGVAGIANLDQDGDQCRPLPERIRQGHGQRAAHRHQSLWRHGFRQRRDGSVVGQMDGNAGVPCPVEEVLVTGARRRRREDLDDEPRTGTGGLEERLADRLRPLDQEQAGLVPGRTPAQLSRLAHPSRPIGQHLPVPSLTELARGTLNGTTYRAFHPRSRPADVPRTTAQRATAGYAGAAGRDMPEPPGGTPEGSPSRRLRIAAAQVPVRRPARCGRPEARP